MSRLEIVTRAGREQRWPGSRVAPRGIERWLPVVLALAVALAAGAAFLPVLDNGFVGTFDDEENFLENVNYRGLGWVQISWA